MATRTASAAGGAWTTAATWVEGAVPTNSDDVVLTSAGGPITVTAGAVCRSLDCTGYTSTFTINTNQNISIGGSVAGTGNVALKLVSGMTVTMGNANSTITFVSTSATQQTIDFGGKTVAAISFAGVGGSWQLQSALTQTSTLSLSGGTLDTNGFAVIATTFTCGGTNARTLTLGASSLSFSTGWTVAGSNITINAGTSTITIGSATPSFAGGGFTYYNLVFSTAINSASLLISGANTFNNLNVGTSAANKLNNITFNGNTTINGTFTINGNSATNRLLISSSIVGTPITLTLNGTISTNNTDWQDIVGAGSGSWDISAVSSGDCGGNSGITFTTATTQTATGTASFSWSTHGWTSRVPLPQDTVSIPNAFVAGRTVTVDMPRLGKDIIFSATGSPIISLSAAASMYGSLTLASGMTTSGTVTLTISGRGTHTFTSNGVVTTWLFNWAGFGGTYTLQDNFIGASTANSHTLTYGTLDLNGHTYSGGVFNSTATSARTLKFSGGTYNLTLTSVATVWFTSASLTIDKTGGGTIAISTASANTRTFIGSGLSYPSFNYVVPGSAGQITFTGNNTFDDFVVTETSANHRNVYFTAGSTTTVNGNFALTGAGSTFYIWVNSPTVAFHTLTKTSGTVSCEHVQIQYSHAGGGAAWYAGADSVDNGNNTGWVFTAAPTGSIVTVTQSAISRIAINRNYTQTSVGRIATNRSLLQNAIARIARNVARTQIAISRIGINRSAIQTAVARISTATGFTKLQTAIARISVYGAKTQSAIARIARSNTKTQSAISRIAVVRTYTQTAIARITVSGSFVKTQTAIARISRSLSSTQTAIARITKSYTKTQSSIARIVTLRTTVQTATGRIASNFSLAQSATGRVAIASYKNQLAIARVQTDRSYIQIATARVRLPVSITQSATARITGGTLYDLNIELDDPTDTLVASVEPLGIEFEVVK